MAARSPFIDEWRGFSRLNISRPNTLAIQPLTIDVAVPA